MGKKERAHDATSSVGLDEVEEINSVMQKTVFVSFKSTFCNENFFFNQEAALNLSGRDEHVCVQSVAEEVKGGRGSI